MKGLIPYLDEAELRHMRTAGQIAGLAVEGGRCFVGDMTDLFGEWVPDDLLNRLFSEVLERRQDVTWQLLTKRADRLQAYLAWRYGEGRIPSRNIHVGVSVENQAAADERIPLLLQTPAAVRFVSYEPALGPVDLGRYLVGRHGTANGVERQPRPVPNGSSGPGVPNVPVPPVATDWIIVGGESGPGARPFDIAWARSVVRQCKTAGVAVFVKQLGARPYRSRQHDDGKVVHAYDEAITLNDRKGGDPAYWPDDLRVREFPKVGA
jgi:protein gp37